MLSPGCAGAAALTPHASPISKAAGTLHQLISICHQENAVRAVAAAAAGRAAHRTLSTAISHQTGNRIVAEGCGYELRVYPRAAGDEEVDRLRLLGAADRVGIRGLRDPARATVLESPHRARRETRKRDPRMLEQILPYRILGVAVAGQHAGMLRAKDDQRARRENHIVVAERGHRADEVIHNLFLGRAPVGKYVVAGRGPDHCDRAVLTPEPVLDVKRAPRIFRLVFGNAEGEFAGLALGSHVGLTGNIAAHVAQHELQGASDRRVRTASL